MAEINTETKTFIYHKIIPKGMQKVLLLILDGFGLRKEKNKNAVKTAKTPVLNHLLKNHPNSRLKASGAAAGLPNGYMGNSEVGHLTIGAGRTVDGDLVRINKAIKNGSFYRNKALLEAVKHVKRNKTKLHLMGLLSSGGVHSHIGHLFALLELAKKNNVKEVYVHAFLDGRDTEPKSAAKYIRMLQKKMKRLKTGQLATLMGRFYAMDRDNRWNREHKAYDCMVNGIGRKDNSAGGKNETNALKALKKAYQRGETDEFVTPTILTGKGLVKKRDAIIFFNFRSDRARELTKAFILGRFKSFKRKKIIDLKFVSLTQYEKSIKIPVAFPPVFPKNTLGEVISRNRLKQLRIAETEKWAHVTYFFNGLCERIFPNESRIHIMSARNVKTYDKIPAMKVNEITNVLLRNTQKYNFFAVNFANGDMVGHTGNFKAAVKAVEFVDKALGKIITRFPGIIFITADHGNCEDMSAGHETSHTTNDVPFIVVNTKRNLKNGGLRDIAPTILQVLGLKKPKEMTGESLF